MLDVLRDDGGRWSPRVLSCALIALRIFAREHSGVEGLVSRDGLLVIARLAGLNGCGFEEAPPPSTDRLEGEERTSNYVCYSGPLQWLLRQLKYCVTLY